MLVKNRYVKNRGVRAGIAYNDRSRSPCWIGAVDYNQNFSGGLVSSNQYHDFWKKNRHTAADQVDARGINCLVGKEKGIYRMGDSSSTAGSIRELVC